MGYEIPAAIGAYYASNQEINCIAGDGSIMMNLQELAYIGGLKLPIRIFWQDPNWSDKSLIHVRLNDVKSPKVTKVVSK